MVFLTWTIDGCRLVLKIKRVCDTWGSTDRAGRGRVHVQIFSSRRFCSCLFIINVPESFMLHRRCRVRPCLIHFHCIYKDVGDIETIKTTTSKIHVAEKSNPGGSWKSDKKPYTSPSTKSSMFNTKKYLEKTSKILSKKILKIYQETIRMKLFQFLTNI